MGKRKPSLDALGAQYREAKASIAPHRRRQAESEVEHSRLLRRLGHDHPDVRAAWERVEQATADVRWCQAVIVAAGEAYKGVSFDQAPHDRGAASAGRERALAALTGDLR